MTAVLVGTSVWVGHGGAVDISPLASALLMPGASLWTLDRSLRALAAKLGVAFEPRRH